MVCLSAYHVDKGRVHAHEMPKPVAVGQQGTANVPRVFGEFLPILSCCRAEDQQAAAGLSSSDASKATDADASPLELSKIRLERISKWRKWSTELQLEEQQARARMHPNVRKVLGRRRAVLLERIAKSLEYPDRSLCQELRSGLRLVGNATPSNVFRPGVTVANLSEQDLMEHALPQTSHPVESCCRT